jgi:uncharacterized protein YuzE
MKGKMNIYYDEDGDYLEIFIESKSPTYGEELGNDITLLKSMETHEVVGIAILNFKKRGSLQNIKLNLPFEVNFSGLSVSNK